MPVGSTPPIAPVLPVADAAARERLAAVESAVAELGVEETHDALGLHALPATDQPPATNTLFVRGAARGGSPFLNLLSHFTFILTLVVVALVSAALWFGGSKLLQLLGKGKDAASAVVGGVRNAVPSGALPTDQSLTCAAPNAPAPASVLGMAPALVLGTQHLPRDTATLATIPGATTMRDAQGHQLDVFAPAGGRLAVRYEGKGPRVQTVSVSLEPAAPFCAALERIGLLPEAATFTMSRDGVVQPVAGSPSVFFSTGVLRIRTAGQGVRLLQLERQPR